jgi:hypothetical protein
MVDDPVVRHGHATGLAGWTLSSSMPRYHPRPAPPDLELAAGEREFDALYANGERDLTGAQLARLEWLAEAIVARR